MIEKDSNAGSLPPTGPKQGDVGRKELDPLYYQQIPNVLFNLVAQKVLIPADIVVYGVLVSHLGGKDFAWPGIDTIAGWQGVVAVA